MEMSQIDKKKISARELMILRDYLQISPLFVELFLCFLGCSFLSAKFVIGRLYV